MSKPSHPSSRFHSMFPQLKFRRRIRWKAKINGQSSPEGNTRKMAKSNGCWETATALTNFPLLFEGWKISLEVLTFLLRADYQLLAYFGIHYQSTYLPAHASSRAYRVAVAALETFVEPAGSWDRECSISEAGLSFRMEGWSASVRVVLLLLFSHRYYTQRIARFREPLKAMKTLRFTLSN